jgi:hypothetical protein
MDKNDVLKNLKERLESKENCPTKAKLLSDIESKKKKTIKK